MTCIVKFNTGTLSSPSLKAINCPTSSNKLYSTFKRSCKFVVINTKAKCLLDIGSSSELLDGALIHFSLPFNLSQLWLVFTTPSAFILFPFTMVYFASVKPLQLTNITFVSFAKEELNNKLFIIKRYLLRANLERKVLISLSFMLISTGFNFPYLLKVCRPTIFTSSLTKLDIFLFSSIFFCFLKTIELKN